MRIIPLYVPRAGKVLGIDAPGMHNIAGNREKRKLKSEMTGIVRGETMAGKEKKYRSTLPRRQPRILPEGDMVMLTGRAGRDKKG